MISGSHFRLYRAGNGDAICEQGEHVSQLYLLVKGKATVSYIAENGNKLIVSFKQAFELFGDIEYIKQMDALHTVEAASEVYLIGIPIDSLHTYAASYPPFLQLLLREVTEKFQLKSKAFSFSLTHGALTRLASYLFRIMSEYDGKRLTGSLPINRTGDIADHIGTTSRHVNRLLTTLAKEGIIERSNSAISIKDWEKLEQLASRSIYA
ncbi:hypothetical protein CHH91_10295 [Virgibacillus sp. 7505]|uniref:Crp/Fnr family transcriptional regulator n=1 Tax=Virgibacillus sp. 7505 TaxID=2022548 RepID=UPI000BA5AE0E|nr:Crp/Fnr family transcriptional regulator [Virgibacillus sp. 7505]PAE16021.1 hypothetical protein CHH91_10295 [Virgibacillus sp. 7505]